MIRDAVTREAVSAATMPCIAVLSYVYDHDTRALAQRLTHALHDHHDLSVAGLHVHLNHESCLEVSVLKGAAASVHDLADALTAQRGVRHANLHLLPAQISTARHDHGAGSVAHQHIRA